MEALGVLILIIIIVLFGLRDESLDKSEKESYREKYPKEDEEPTFYHPVTGYKGTKSEMDTYIANRERKMKKEKS